MPYEYSDEMIEEEASKLGLTAKVVAGGDIVIRSPFGGHWMLTLAGNGWKLKHENYHIGGSCERGTYHKHNKVYPDPYNAMEYIRVHDKPKVHKKWRAA